MNALLGAAIALAAAAFLAFAGVAVHEFNYASTHPHAFGPAKVIAIAACAGAGLSAAMGLTALAVLRAGVVARAAEPPPLA